VHSYPNQAITCFGFLYKEGELFVSETAKHINPPEEKGGKRPAFVDRDLTKGSITGNLWALTWPTTISSTIFMLGPMIDMIWVAKLGSAAIAGVGVSGIAVMVIDSARMGLNTGTRALLSRFIGGIIMLWILFTGRTRLRMTLKGFNFDGNILWRIVKIGSVIIWFWAENIVHIFNREPKLVNLTANFLKINIVSYMVFGVVVVLMNCLNGAGDTMVPMVTTLTTMWLVQVPMAYILPKVTDLGVYGVRWGIVSAIVMRAVIYTIYFKNGRWKRKEV